MNQHTSIDPQHFVEVVREPLELRDAQQLARCLHELWTDEQVIGLLDSSDADVRKLAALALGLIGTRSCIVPLARALKDRDPMVNEMAEHALWSVWFRCGKRDAREAMRDGAELLGEKRYADAIDRLADAIGLDPTYAEAYNQRSLTYYLLEDYHAALEDAQHVVQLMPVHFGAWSGLGHCYAHLGQTGRAADCYRRALAINPHLHGIREILTELRAGQCALRYHRD